MIMEKIGVTIYRSSTGEAVCIIAHGRMWTAVSAEYMNDLLSDDTLVESPLPSSLEMALKRGLHRGFAAAWAAWEREPKRIFRSMVEIDLSLFPNLVREEKRLKRLAKRIPVRDER